MLMYYPVEAFLGMYLLCVYQVQHLAKHASIKMHSSKQS
jgi:hypothetical protein